MENEPIENNELEEIVEESIEEPVATTDLTVDDYNELKKKLQTAIAQKEHWRKKATTPKEEVAPKPLQTTANADDAWRERLELKVEGYKDDEIDFIQKNGGRKALENPIVKTAIESIRTQRQAESAVIDTDTTKSEVERKYTQDQLRDMPVSELEKLLPKA